MWEHMFDDGVRSRNEEQVPSEDSENEARRTRFYFGVALLLPLLVLLAIGLWGSITALRRGNTNVASAYSSFASGIATVILVLLTGFYAYQTKIQAKAAKEARNDRERMRREKRQAKQDTIRKSILHEIESTVDITGVSEDTVEMVVEMDDIVPKRIYENNTENLGLLSEEEINKIVEYYNTAALIEDVSSAQKAESVDVTTQIAPLLELLSRKQREAVAALRENT